jgi:hypothetical protein
LPIYHHLLCWKSWLVVRKYWGGGRLKSPPLVSVETNILNVSEIYFNMQYYGYYCLLYFINSIYHACVYRVYLFWLTLCNFISIEEVHGDCNCAHTKHRYVYILHNIFFFSILQKAKKKKMS